MVGEPVFDSYDQEFIILDYCLLDMMCSKYIDIPNRFYKYKPQEDLKMLNKEKFAKEILEIACSGDGFSLIGNTIGYCKLGDCRNCNFRGKISCDKTKMNWANSEYKKPPILTDREKSYLENIIRPFKNDFKAVFKFENSRNGFITICVGDEEIIFPDFQKDKYYCGMETEKDYTLKELGLFESEE